MMAKHMHTDRQTGRQADIHRQTCIQADKHAYIHTLIKGLTSAFLRVETE